jgi:hypothetical protein
METINENLDIYQNADLIVQTTYTCNRDCSGCYLKNLGSKIELSHGIYCNHLATLNKNDLIVLRGGEITMLESWFEKFVEPAIKMELQVIVETNGFLLRTIDFYDIISKISTADVFFRISFDKMHLEELSAKEIQLEFNKMFLFVSDFEIGNINFGFYSLDMSNSEMLNFIKDTVLEPYLKYFHSLKRYGDISKIPLKGKYLRADGALLNRIVH